MYISNDYGATFEQRVPDGLGSPQIYTSIAMNALAPSMLFLADGQYVVAGSQRDGIFLSSDGGASCFLENSLVNTIVDGSEVKVPIQSIRQGAVLKSHNGSSVRVNKVVYGKLNINFDLNKVYFYEKNGDRLLALEGHSLLYESHQDFENNKKGLVSDAVYQGVIKIDGFHHVLMKDHKFARKANMMDVQDFVKDNHLYYYHLVWGDKGNVIYVNNVMTESMSESYYSSIIKEMKILH